MIATQCICFFAKDSVKLHTKQASDLLQDSFPRLADSITHGRQSIE